MSSPDRRIAARRRAWGRGPSTLRFTPPAEPHPAPADSLRLVDATPTPALGGPSTHDWGGTFTIAATPHTLIPTPTPTPTALRLVDADGRPSAPILLDRPQPASAAPAVDRPSEPPREAPRRRSFTPGFKPEGHRLSVFPSPVGPPRRDLDRRQA